MTHTDCPACTEGLTTTSKTPNLLNHIKRKAAYELLDKYLIEKGDTKHAEWLKANTMVLEKAVYIVRS